MDISSLVIPALQAGRKLVLGQLVGVSCHPVFARYCEIYPFAKPFYRPIRCLARLGPCYRCRCEPPNIQRGLPRAYFVSIWPSGRRILTRVHRCGPL